MLEDEVNWRGIWDVRGGREASTAGEKAANASGAIGNTLPENGPDLEVSGNLGHSLEVPVLLLSYQVQEQMVLARPMVRPVLLPRLITIRHGSPSWPS